MMDKKRLAHNEKNSWGAMRVSDEVLRDNGTCSASVQGFDPREEAQVLEKQDAVSIHG